MQRDDFKVRRFPGIESVGLSDAAGRLRVAIVTEEIIGPVRNGGIASTYYHLAKGLAARGHEVHVLFLKGPVVQDETPEFWVERYAEFGVTLHYLEVSETPLWCASPSWQRRYASAYEWLRDQEPFDVVHTSEWRGGLVYALMAKRLGLAFRDTLFLVKTSSPHIWNRHYQMLPITDTNLLAAAYAEQKCVELADVVIGGSAHLLSFMDRIGYRLPETNVFVQPNIVDFSNVPVIDRRPGAPRQHGDVVKSRDLVFFGRLEARKGIEIFCNAIDLLHERGEIPDSVTFLGKWGGKLPAQGGLSPEEYIAEKAETWECPVVTITDKNQPAALTFLTSRDQIAVMPSLIENSTMAVYETLEQRVPFIATSVGGTPELIAERDHATCLVEPTSQDLADRLLVALREGQAIAHPQFSNDDNLDVWYGFHSYLGEQIQQHGRTEAVGRVVDGIDRPGTPVDTVSHVALVRRGESLEDLVKACHAEAPDELVLGYTDGSVRTAIERVRGLIDQACRNVQVVNCLGQTSGTALNTLVAHQTSDAMLITDGLAALPQYGFFAAARQALSHRPGTLFTTFFSTDDTVIGMPLGGDVASQIVTSLAYGPQMVALRRETFDVIGSFEPYDARYGIVHEYVTRAAESGHDLLVLPEQLLSWPDAEATARPLKSDQLYAYLKAKPLIDASPLSQRKVLLAALHGGAGKSAGGVDERMLRIDSVEEGETLWLMPASWDPQDASGVRGRRVIFGLNAAADEIWLYARGPGERRLLVRGEDVPVELVETRGVEGTEEYVTLSVLRLPASWPSSTSYPLIWGLYDGEEKLRNAFLRVNKIGAKTFALSGRSQVLSARVLTELMDRQVLRSPEPAPLAVGLEPVVDEPDRIDELVKQAVAVAMGVAKAPVVVDETDQMAEVTAEPVFEGLVAVDESDRTDELVQRAVAVAMDAARALVVVDGPDRTDELVQRAVAVAMAAVKALVVVDGPDRTDELVQRAVAVAMAAAKAPVVVDGPDRTDELVNQAVAAAMDVVNGRFDPDRIVEHSRRLLERPVAGPPPITARSGLKPPERRDNWAEGEWLTGWAWDREDHDRVLHVAVIRNGQPLLVVPADHVDRSLEDVPGRGKHAFRIPVLPEFLEGDGLRLQVWEAGTDVYRGRLYVDHGAKPVLRRVRDDHKQPGSHQGRRDEKGKRRWWTKW